LESNQTRGEASSDDSTTTNATIGHPCIRVAGSRPWRLRLENCRAHDIDADAVVVERVVRGRTRERGTRPAERYVYFLNITMSFDVAYHVSIVKNHPCVAMWLINSSTTHMRTSISSCP